MIKLYKPLIVARFRYWLAQKTCKHQFHSLGAYLGQIRLGSGTFRRFNAVCLKCGAKGEVVQR